eukprot:gene15802-663_t
MPGKKKGGGKKDKEGKDKKEKGKKEDKDVKDVTKLAEIKSGSNEIKPGLQVAFGDDDEYDTASEPDDFLDNFTEATWDEPNKMSRMIRWNSHPGTSWARMRNTGTKTGAQDRESDWAQAELYSCGTTETRVPKPEKKVVKKKSVKTGFGNYSEIPKTRLDTKSLTSPSQSQ